jgi:hypothetical protein
MMAYDQKLADAETEIERLRSALKPFADYADPSHIVPAFHLITNGSPMAKKQLTMGDCYEASQASQIGIKFNLKSP